MPQIKISSFCHDQQIINLPNRRTPHAAQYQKKEATQSKNRQWWQRIPTAGARPWQSVVGSSSNVWSKENMKNEYEMSTQMHIWLIVMIGLCQSYLSECLWPILAVKDCKKRDMGCIGIMCPLKWCIEKKPMALLWHSYQESYPKFNPENHVTHPPKKFMAYTPKNSHWKDWYIRWSFDTLATWFKELTL